MVVMRRPLSGNAPSREECYRLIRQMQMLENIVAHSRLVCGVALFLTDRLIDLGHLLDRELVRASALLHDITKTRSFKTRENHAETGGDFLRRQGYPEVGRIICQHVLLEDFKAHAPPTEAEIVNYADKRVLHDRISSLNDRMAYIRDRYCKKPEHVPRMERMWAESLAVEEKLFRLLGFKPEDVERLVGREKSE